MNKFLSILLISLASSGIFAAERQALLLEAVLALNNAALIHQLEAPVQVEKMLKKHDGNNDFKKMKRTKPKKQRKTNKQLRKAKVFARKDTK